LKLSDWRPALDAVAADESLDEAILSGGDPLMRTDDWLAAFVGELAEIPHLARLRVHTRLPVVLPSRVCDEMLTWLTGSRLAPYVAIHANHPAEIDDEVIAACRRLTDAGAVVLCQSVLLAGVNDDVDVLTELCLKLANARVLPYYLHQLDRVAGAAHFEVSESAGRRLIERLTERLPGYAVPKYVREVPGALGKSPIPGFRP
jgi:KamA family protein